MKQERFDKIIATQFNISRKDARIAIRRGKATLDGKILRDFGALVNVDADITFNGQALSYKKYVYILMNKPDGVVSATEDGRDKTVIDLLPEELQTKKGDNFILGVAIKFKESNHWIGRFS